MKMIVFVLLNLCFSCSTKSTNQIKDNNILMNDLWQKKATAEDVKKVFGDNFKQVDSGIIYTFPSSKFPERGFFFDSSDKLRGQFIFMNKAALENFKKAITCDWKESEEKKTIAHYTKMIKKGSCSSLSISYEADPSLNAFEVRWKK